MIELPLEVVGDAAEVTGCRLTGCQRALSGGRIFPPSTRPVTQRAETQFVEWGFEVFSRGTLPLEVGQGVGKGGVAEEECQEAVHQVADRRKFIADRIDISFRSLATITVLILALPVIQRYFLRYRSSRDQTIRST